MIRAMVWILPFFLFVPDVARASIWEMCRRVFLGVAPTQAPVPPAADPIVQLRRERSLAELRVAEEAVWQNRMQDAITRALGRSGSYHATDRMRRQFLEGLLRIDLGGTAQSREADFAALRGALSQEVGTHKSSAGIRRDLETFLEEMEGVWVAPSREGTLLDVELARSRRLLDVLDAYGRKHKLWSATRLARVDVAPQAAPPPAETVQRQALTTAPRGQFGLSDPPAGSEHYAAVVEGLRQARELIGTTLGSQMQALPIGEFGSLMGSRELVLRALLSRGESSELNLTAPGALETYIGQSIGFRVSGAEAATVVDAVLGRVRERARQASASGKTADGLVAARLNEYATYLERVKGVLGARGHRPLTLEEIDAMRPAPIQAAAPARVREKSGPVWGIAETRVMDAEVRDREWVTAELERVRDAIVGSFEASHTRVPEAERSRLNGMRDLVLRAVLGRGEAVGQDFSDAAAMGRYLETELGARATGVELATLVDGVIRAVDARLASGPRERARHGGSAERVVRGALEEYRVYLAGLQQTLRTRGFEPSNTVQPVVARRGAPDPVAMAMEPIFVSVRNAVAEGLRPGDESGGGPPRLLTGRRVAIENLVRVGHETGDPLYEAAFLDGYLRELVQPKQGEAPVVSPEELNITVYGALEVVQREILARAPVRGDTLETLKRKETELEYLEGYRDYWDNVRKSVVRVGYGRSAIPDRIRSRVQTQMGNSKAGR